MDDGYSRSTPQLPYSFCNICAKAPSLLRAFTDKLLTIDLQLFSETDVWADNTPFRLRMSKGL